MQELLTIALTIVGGAVLAQALARQPWFRPAAFDGPLRQASASAGVLFERADACLRRWPSATILLLAAAALFGWLMRTHG
jgi:hypothetical protein